MDMIRNIILNMKPDSMMPVAFLLAAVGMGLIAYIAIGQSKQRQSARNRLSLDISTEVSGSRVTDDIDGKSKPMSNKLASNKLLKQASDYYSKTDPDNINRIRQKLIRAGYLEPGAVGTYFVLRLVVALVLAISSFIAILFFSADLPLANKLAGAGMLGLLGYFLPNLVLKQKISTRMFEYNSGFPDFMDLMIVCADAGMSMEAAIERVSREITTQYPALSQNLTIVTIELRAGRQLADALKSLSDRLGLDEVRSFATLLQQSKELGTSLSDTLRVFSEEMRHKRMSLVEEKAHALPAKLTVPVTMFILPVIMLIATIPVIVQLSQ